MFRKVAALLASFLLGAQAQASFLSDITGINVDVPNGTINFNVPQPQRIPEMLRNLPQDVGRAILNPAGLGLATTIRASYGQVRGSAQPIPLQIRQILQPFFPPNVLNKAQWVLQDNTGFNLANFVIHCGGNSAVTLDNVIVFRGPTERDDPILWAHELIHVGQYDRLGVEGFAHFYSIDWNGLENEAYSWENYVAGQIGNPQSQQTVHYSVAPQLQSQQIQPVTDQDWVNAAKATYNAEICAVWQAVPGGVQVSNVCRIPIVITGWTQAVPPYGQPVNVQCVSKCIFGPGVTDNAWSTLPGPMVALYFVYY